MKKIVRRSTSFLLVIVMLIISISLNGVFGNFGIKATAAESQMTISTAQELSDIRNNLSGNYILNNNIDLSSFGSWSPIGTEEEPFTGTFDGNGYAISNITIDYSVPTNIGFFGYVKNATIKNLGIEKADYNVVIGDYEEIFFSNVGGFAGVIENSTIDCCYFTGSISHTVGNYVYCRSAGIACSAPNSTITNCYVNASIYGKALACNTMVAGFVSWLDNTTIDKCYVAGSVVAENSGYSYAGGFNASSNSSSIFGIIISYGGTVRNSVNLLSELSSTGSTTYVNSIGNWVDSSNNKTISPSSTEANSKNTYESLEWDFELVWFINDGLPKLVSLQKTVDTDGEMTNTKLIGTFESYVVSVLTTESSTQQAKSWISSITVDGKEYSIKGQLLPFGTDRLDTYDKYIGQKVALSLTNNIVTKIKFVSEIKTNLNCTITSDKDNLTYTNGKYSDKELNLKVWINNCVSGDNALGAGLDELGVYVESVTLSTSNKNLLTFNKGWWIFNGDGDSEITIPVNKTIPCGDSQSVISLEDIPDISAKLDVNTSHKISKDKASESATITCTIKGSQNGKSFLGSGSRTFTVSNNDYSEPSTVSDVERAAAKAFGDVQGSMTLADMDLNGSLSKLCTQEQLEQVKNLLFCAVALYQCPKKSFSEYLDDKIMEKVFGVQTNLIGSYNGKIVLTTYIKHKDYGKLEIQFCVDFSKYLLSGIDIGALGFDVQYNVTGGSGKKNIPSEISQSGSCGMVAQVNMKNFCNAMEKVALSELKKAYNKGRGNDLNKAVDVIFGKTFNNVLKAAKKLHIINVGSASDIEWSILTMAKKKYTIKCPVDVYIYDNSGNMAAGVVGDQITINDINIDITLNGDIKNVTIYDGDYTFEYVSTAKGTLNIEIEEYANDEQQLRAVTIENIPLEIGKSYKQKSDGKIFNDSDYSLIEKDETEFTHTTDVDCIHNHASNGEWKESGQGYRYSLCSACNEWIIEPSNVYNKVKVVSISDISLNYKGSTTLKPTITADDGAEYTVKYSTSNPKVATVDKNGKVTATKRGSGSATITCTVTDSNGNTVTDTCKVNVKLSFGQKIIVYVLFGWIWY